MISIIVEQYISKIIAALAVEQNCPEADIKVLLYKEGQGLKIASFKSDVFVEYLSSEKIQKICTT